MNNHKEENMGSEFKELSKAKIQSTRNLVISRRLNNGTYTLGQQIVVQEGGKEMVIFLKGAYKIDSLEGLYELRDALNDAIEQEEKRNSD